MFAYEHSNCHTPVRPPGDQTCLSEGGEPGACRRNTPVSEQLVARLRRGKSEVADQQGERRLEVDWRNQKNNISFEIYLRREIKQKVTVKCESAEPSPLPLDHAVVGGEAVL